MSRKILFPFIVVVLLCVATIQISYSSIVFNEEKVSISFSELNDKEDDEVMLIQDWSMMNMNAQRTGFNPSSFAPNSPSLQWEYPIGPDSSDEGSPSSIAVVDDLIYVADKDGYLYCLNVDGQSVWTHLSNGTGASSGGPCIYQDSVFYLDIAGDLRCLNRFNGSIIWITDLFSGDDASDTAPAVLDDTVFVSCYKSVFSVNATTGVVNWQFEDPEDCYTYDVAISEDGLVYVGTFSAYIHKTKHLYCFDGESGTLLWTLTLKSDESLWAAPTIHDDLLFVPALHTIYCLNRHTGEEYWAVSPKTAPDSEITIAYGRLYVSLMNGDTNCFDLETGELLWEFIGPSDLGQYNIVVADSKAYFSNGYMIFCLHALTGEKVWSYNTGYWTGCHPTIYNDSLYVAGNFQKVLCFKDPDTSVLDVDGSLTWSEVKPSSSHTATISVRNSGRSNSLLNWSVTEIPDWGSWSISPIEGSNLTPLDGVQEISVTVTAPDLQKSTFTGNLTLTNLDNSENTVQIPISLTTPRLSILEQIFLWLEYLFAVI